MRDVFDNDVLLKKTIRNRLGLDWLYTYHNGEGLNEAFNLSFRMLIQGFRSQRLVPQISMFKPDIAKHIVMKYSEPGDVVGDYSCGFGGRLLGAVSCGRKYIGTDPLTTPELEEMVRFYGFENVRLIRSGSEDYCDTADSVDLYYSSPPYYDQEVYSNDTIQAYSRGERYFYDVYWKKTLDNVRYMLKPGKWFGLNVKNYPRMLTMAQEVFGPEKETIALRTVRSHLSKKAGAMKNEYVYMFRK